MSDFKNFLSYIFSFSEFIKETKDLLFGSFKEFFKIKNLRNLFFFLTIITILCNIYFKTVGRNIPIIFAVLTILFHYRLIYLGGAHRDWYRKKLGIQSKKQLIRKEWSEESGETNPKIISNVEVNEE